MSEDVEAMKKRLAKLKSKGSADTPSKSSKSSKSSKYSSDSPDSDSSDSGSDSDKKSKSRDKKKKPSPKPKAKAKAKPSKPISSSESDSSSLSSDDSDSKSKSSKKSSTVRKTSISDSPKVNSPKPSQAVVPEPAPLKPTKVVDEPKPIIKEPSKRDTSALKDKIRQTSKVIKTIDCCFLMDITGSMQSWIDTAKANIKEIVKAIKVKYPSYDIRIGFVGYRDYGDSVPVVNLGFTNDPQAFETYLGSVKADGGADYAEDVFIGLNEVVETFDWNANIRILFHIADAPCHGTDYHDKTVGDSHATTPHPKGYTSKALLTKLRDERNVTNYFFIRINDSTDIMIKRFKAEFDFENKNASLEEGNLGGDTSKFFEFIVKSISDSVSKPPPTPVITKK